MAYGGRFIDFVRNLTAKSTTIDGTEQTHIDSSGLSMKTTLANLIRYGGGSPRNETVGNATVTRTTDGAIYLEVAGQPAGNARGAGAFDWQPIRSQGSQVASGAQGFAFGQYNTVNGLLGFAFGSWCTAASQAFAFGSSSIAATSGGWAIGSGSYANNPYQFAFGGSSGSYIGCTQGNLQTLFSITTDATPNVMSIANISGYRMVIPATRSVAFTGIVQAMCNVSSTSNFIKAWEIKGVITRDGNNTTRIVGTPIIVELAKDADGTPTPSTWAITSITADDTNEALAINVTGQAGQTIRWQSVIIYSQVGF